MMGEVAKVQRVPMVTEAMRYTGRNVKKLRRFAGSRIVVHEDGVKIITDEGPLQLTAGSWVVRNVDGGFHPVSNGVMKRSYRLWTGCQEPDCVRKKHHDREMHRDREGREWRDGPGMDWEQHRFWEKYFPNELRENKKRARATEKPKLVGPRE